MANYKTGAQRYNDRMDKIWGEAMAIKRRDCKHKYYDDKDFFTDKIIKKCVYCGAKK